jgi:branched-chain amino acid aminotransferase
MKKIISNNGLISEADFNSAIFSSDRSIYEVVRVIDGVAIFLGDHFVRLQKSFKTQGIVFDVSFKDFAQNVSELICLNQITDGNFKFVYSIVENTMHWAFYFIHHSYPTKQDYIRGVSTDLLYAERENPNAKIIQNRIRERANQLIYDGNLYEMLLVDREERITEGSRSNVFFVKDEVFYTAPESMVLVGITRQKVIECIRKLGFSIVEIAVAESDVFRFDSVFLTGTSPKVLPIRSIGNQIYNTQIQCIKMLMDSYDKSVAQYISQNSLKR